jgi:glycosyltransferase involved in cell wall biosynthesis
MKPAADVCLIVEGGYPYLLGGVASWLDAFIKSFPQLRIHIVSLVSAAQERKMKYAIPSNVVGITDLSLDRSPPGRAPTHADREAIEAFAASMQDLLTRGDRTEFARMMTNLQRTGLGRRALLDSKMAWQAMERVYDEIMPKAPLLDFFWTWRHLVGGVLAISSAPIPRASLYHAVATGYAGLLAARAQCLTGRPMVITEHGIYTNERRIEISVAEWIFTAKSQGFSLENAPGDLRDLWLGAFLNFSRLAYDFAEVITTQYQDNQVFQRLDGAPDDKMRIIPNGIDVAQYSGIQRSREPHRPTVALVSRVVPIKDVRTFIAAAGLLSRKIPDLEALIIGPDDEDPVYAGECHDLVQRDGLENVVTFLGRVPDLKTYFSRIDAIALTSLSEAQPLILLEAGAAGIPAVVSDVGSCRELLGCRVGDPIEEAGGIVVGACDPQATADALGTLLLDRPLRDRMGEAARRRVGEYYNKDRIDQLYDGLYTSLFAAKAAAQKSA